MLSYFACVAHVLGLSGSLEIHWCRGQPVGVPYVYLCTYAYVPPDDSVEPPRQPCLPWPFKVGNIKLHTDAKVITENLLWRRHMCLQ